LLTRTTQGYCALDKVEFPLTSFGGGDGEGQMKHWVENFDMNVFRLRELLSYLSRWILFLTPL
jgi:endoglucanase